MNTYTISINGGAVNTCESLRLSPLSITWSNGGGEKLLIDVPASPGNALALAHDDLVWLWDSTGALIFTGRALSPGRTLTPGARRGVVEIAGPHQMLDEYLFARLQYGRTPADEGLYATPSTFGLDPYVAKCRLFTHNGGGNLGQPLGFNDDYHGAAASYTDQAQELLQMALDRVPAGTFQIGTVALGDDKPVGKWVFGESIWAMLVKVVTAVPDGLLWCDHSTYPPTLHARRYSELPATGYTHGHPPLVSASFATRWDLCANGLAVAILHADSSYFSAEYGPTRTYDDMVRSPSRVSQAARRVRAMEVVIDEYTEHHPRQWVDRLYSDLGTVWASGEIVLARGGAWSPVVRIDGLAPEQLPALYVQQVTHDLLTGQRRLTFGPPGHLDAADLAGRSQAAAWSHNGTPNTQKNNVAG
jgi:hypothetical protein